MALTLTFALFLVFLVHEHGKYWTKPVKVSNRTVDALKESIVKTLRPECNKCIVCAIYNKYNKALRIRDDLDVKLLPSYTELEANIIDF